MNVILYHYEFRANHQEIIGYYYLGIFCHTVTFVRLQETFC